MTKQASSEPKAGLTDRITRAQSSKSSRTLEGPSERRRTRASSSLDQQGSKVVSTRNLRSSAPEQPVPVPPPRKRWFLECVEIPPYPRTARRLPRPTLEKPPQSERTNKRRSARSAQGASSPPLKRLRRSKRGRAERSPSAEGVEGTASKVRGQFDWWYESSLSPLTDIGSRPPSPVGVAVEAVLEGREEELGVPKGGTALAPHATVDGTAAGEEDLQANPPIGEPPQHPMDAPENGEIPSLPSVPAEEGYLSDDGCPTEAQRGSPICEGLVGEPASSPAVTSINSPEVIAEPLAPPRLEATPVNEIASAKLTVEVRTEK
ncbi:hypothetical protein FS837_002005 [Tulasnella sp. UAMH 9824]|nr:hypothetical protein FS837_002005 [Tulasnella sp. UAMH 9824]